jgi:hypothetical protein
MADTCAFRLHSQEGRFASFFVFNERLTSFLPRSHELQLSIVWRSEGHTGRNYGIHIMIGSWSLWMRAL